MVYAVGLLAQLPFLVTHFCTGPLVERLGGAAVSWIVGLAVPALLYRLLARRTPRPGDLRPDTGATPSAAGRAAP